MIFSEASKLCEVSALTNAPVSFLEQWCRYRCMMPHECAWRRGKPLRPTVSARDSLGATSRAGSCVERLSPSCQGHRRSTPQAPSIPRGLWPTDPCPLSCRTKKKIRGSTRSVQLQETPSLPSLPAPLPASKKGRYTIPRDAKGFHFERKWQTNASERTDSRPNEQGTTTHLGSEDLGKEW